MQAVIKKIGLQIEPKQPIKYDYRDNADLSDLPCGINYLLVMPFAFHEASNPSNYSKVPFILTFAEETLAIKSLVHLYSIQVGLIQEKYQVEFTLESGLQINNFTVQQLKLNLGRSNLNGLVVFINTHEKQKYKIFQQYFLPGQAQIIEQQYISSSKQKFYLSKQQYSIKQENAILTYFQKQKQFGQKDLNILVEIPYLHQLHIQTQVVVVKASSYNSIQTVLAKILEEISRSFQLKIDKNQVSAIRVKNKDKVLHLHQRIHDLGTQIHGKTLVLVLQLNNKKVKFVVKEKQNNCSIIIYKEGMINPLLFRFTKFFSQLTFQQVYKEHLERQESKQRKDLKFGLLVMDTVVKPNDKLEVLLKYFKKGLIESQTIVGKVITEKMLFFHIVDKIIPPNYNFIHQQQVKVVPKQQQIQKKIKQTVENVLNVQQKYRSYSQIKFQLITIYTSQLKYFQGEKQISFYKGINTFLRDNPLLTLDLTVQKIDWKYKYSNSLLQALEKIEKVQKCKVYRGITFNPVPNKDTKILIFKQFISTSQFRQNALQFAQKSQNKTKYFLEMTILLGYSISQFSVFQHQKEILVQPYSQFEIESMKQTSQKDYTLVTVKLNQIHTEKNLPAIIANFILWVDDKSKQQNKKSVFDSLKIHKDTSLFLQLGSTEELKEWLEKHAFLFNESTAKIVFLSNMARTQNGQPNYRAGVQGAQLIRQYKKDLKVFFYVGNVERAKQSSKVLENNVFFGNSPQQAIKFIEKEIGLQ